MNRVKRLGGSPAVALAVVALIAAGAGTALAGSGPGANTAGKADRALKKAKRALKIAKQTSKEQGPKGDKGEQGDKGDQGDPGLSTGAAGGDLTGSYPNPSIAANAVDSAKVANDSLTGADIDESSLTGVAPSGAAGGDLTGTYPNPTIGASNVSGAKASAQLRTKVVTQRIAGLSGSDDRFLLVAPTELTILQVTLVSDTATTGSDGSNNWGFNVRNVTQAEDLTTLGRSTNGSEIGTDQAYALSPNTNLTLSANDVLELEITQNGTPTSLAGAEIMAQVRYQVLG